MAAASSAFVPTGSSPDFPSPQGDARARLEGRVYRTSAVGLRLAEARLGWHWAIAKSALRIARSAAVGINDAQIHRDRDFGFVRNKGPQEEHVVRNADEAREVMADAYFAGRSMNLAGGCHSSNGQTLSAGGIRLRIDPTAWGEPVLREDLTVEVPGPMRWGEVESFLARRGRGVPVLTDHLGTTVAGTLSVGGGIGTRSVSGGRQVDQVEAIHLLLPTGEALWVSPNHEPDLFRFCLGGQGTIGLIDRVVLRTIERRPFVAQVVIQLESLSDAAWVADELRRPGLLPENFSHLDIVGPILDTRVVQLTLGFEFTESGTAHDFLKRLPPCLRRLGRRVTHRRVVEDIAHANHARSAFYIGMLTHPKRPHRFYWNDYFLPSFGSYHAFLRELETTEFAGAGSEYLMAGLGLAYRVFPERPTLPMSGMRTLPGEHPYSIGLNYAVPVDVGPGVGQRHARALMALQSRVVDFGGRPYRYGYSNAGPEELEAMYGDDYRMLRALRQRVDPEGLLNPDVL